VRAFRAGIYETGEDQAVLGSRSRVFCLCVGHESLATYRFEVFLKRTAMTYDTSNVFAKILNGDIPCCKVYENEHAFAFMDVMPWSDGHTLVVPKSQATNLFDADPASLGHLITAVQTVAIAVRTAFKPDGLRLVQNNEAAAGQTVFHLHMHIVPCYNGVPLHIPGPTMADRAMLEEHAVRIRAALDQR
jgi:histidine triad (HIT) family protein